MFGWHASAVIANEYPQDLGDLGRALKTGDFDEYIRKDSLRLACVEGVLDEFPYGRIDGAARI